MMNVKKFSRNKNNIKINNVSKGSPSQKENIKLGNSKYLSLLKNNKKIKSPLREQSKNSILYNSPSNNISEDRNLRSKKNKDSLDDKITVQNKKKITSGKIINNNFIKKNIDFGSPNSNKLKTFNTNNFKGSPRKIIPGSPNSSIPIHLIEELLSPQNYNGNFKNLVDGRKITENCILNDKKKSKFYILEDENIINYAGKWDILRGVCSKCAVKFANTGIQCEEIIENLIELRKNRLNTFENNYKNLKALISNSVNNLELHLEKINSKKDQQLSSINKIFNNIFNSINSYKTEIENYINENYNKEIDGISKVIVEFDKFTNEIISYNSDIKNNYEIIINEDFKQEDFHKILNKYEIRLDNIFKFNEEINDMKSQIPVIEKGKFNKNLSNLKNNIFSVDEWEIIFDNEIKLYEKEKEIIENNEISIINKDDEENKSDIIISFDEKKYQSYWNFEKEKNSEIQSNNKLNNDGNSSEINDQKYLKILDKISSSQKNKNSFYSSFIKNNNTNTNNKIEEEDSDSQNSLQNDENNWTGDKNNCIVFNVNEDENWENKQTPQLGEKDELPDSLQKVLDNNNNKSKCHKILF